MDYKNPNRAPLLFISGSEDPSCPPSIQRSNAKHYKAEGTITEVVEYEGRAHLMPAQTGWEEIADYRPRLGGRARKGTSRGVGNDDAVAVLRRGGGSRSVAPPSRARAHAGAEPEAPSTHLP